MRKGSLIVVAMVAAGISVAVLARVLHVATGPRSVLLISVDTLRADRLGVYGRTPTITPRMDELAARGTAFMQCWTTAPLTVPAHTSLMTGLTPPHHGLRTNNPPGRLASRAARPFATLAESFRGAGCATAAFVSAGVLRKERTGLDAGFDVYDQIDAPAPGQMHDSRRSAEETVTAALDWIAKTDRPFFVWVHLFDPHGPYDAPAPYGPGPRHSSDAQGYDGAVEYTDHWVGELIDGLGRAGRSDAVVALTADHGESLGEHGEATHGFLLHEATLHVPLVVVAAGLVPAGARETRPVSLVNVAQTLRALGRLELSDTIASNGLFLKDASQYSKEQYAESLYGFESCAWSQLFASRDGDTKWVDSGSVVRKFDLAADPLERAPLLFLFGTYRGPIADRVKALRVFAGEEPLSALDASQADGTAPGYYGPLDDSARSILSAEDNAARLDPYDRMADLMLLDAGRTQLAAGLAEEAAKLFRRAVEADPRNPQAMRWLARALRDTHPHAAFENYMQAFELGWRTPDCMSMAAQAAILASDGEAPARPTLGAALTFFERARRLGVRDTGTTLGWEALLFQFAGDPEAAAAAFEKARAAAPMPGQEEFLDRVSEQLVPR